MTVKNITLPVGRIVQGSLYIPQTTDAEGKQLVIKNGPNAGQPRVNYYFGVAIPKNPGETHFAHAKITRADGSVNDWGAQIWAHGHAEMPNGAQSPAFAWKIEDGDSQVPNKSGRKPCDQEGFKGHWIVRCSGGYAPRIVRQQNREWVQMLEKDAVKPGHFVEVAIGVEGNGSTSQPGIYINHSIVAFSAFGTEINFGPDAASAGFGQTPLPAGASAIPVGSGAPMPSVAPAPGASVPPPLPPSGSAPPPAAPAPVAAAPAIPVVPNAQFAQVPPPAAAAAPVPAAPPAKQMTALAGGASYEAFIAQGWTDATLVQNGYMIA